MNIRAFHPLKDYSAVKRWAQGRGLPMMPIQFLSTAGMVAESHGEVVAAMWLYRYEGVPLGRLDNLIADPTTSAEDREEAMAGLFSGLIARAKDLNLQMLYACSTKPRVVTQFGKHGFKKMDSENYCLVMGVI